MPPTNTRELEFRMRVAIAMKRANLLSYGAPVSEMVDVADKVIEAMQDMGLEITMKDKKV